MDILQSWLNQKGDRSAEALAVVLLSLNYDPEAVITAIQGERKAKILEDLASARKQAEALGVTKTQWNAIKPTEEPVDAEPA